MPLRESSAGASMSAMGPKRRWGGCMTAVAVLAVAFPAPATAAPIVDTSGPCALPTPPDVYDLYEGYNDSEMFLDLSEPYRAVTLFVDFSDAPASETTQALAGDLLPVVTDYYSAVSFGRFDYEIEAVHEWYRLPKSSAAYGIKRGMDFFEFQAYLQDAVNAADADVDFSNIDAVYLVPPRESGIEYSPSFVATPGYGVTADGSEIRFGITMGTEQFETQIDRYAAHAFVHEVGHNFGLPDLYAFDGATEETAHRFVGGWDIMGSIQAGAGSIGWHRYKLGWLLQSETVCLSSPGTTSVTLTSLGGSGGTQLVIVPLGDKRFYVAEYRVRAGADSQMCDEGLLVYQVDGEVGTGMGPVQVEAAGTAPSEQLRYQCGEMYDAPFDSGAGETAVFSDPVNGVSFEVLGRTSAELNVRVSVQTGVPLEVARTVNLRLAKHLVVKGEVVSGAPACASGVTVAISRKRSSGWRSVGSVVTGADGRFRGKVTDKAGVYRVTVAESAAPGNLLCLGTSDTARHKH